MRHGQPHCTGAPMLNARFIVIKLRLPGLSTSLWVVGAAVHRSPAQHPAHTTQLDAWLPLLLPRAAAR